MNNAPATIGAFAGKLPREREPKREKPVFTDEAREALIYARRTMKQVRRWQAENKARIDAEWDAIPHVPLTIEEHIAEARASMGEERWAALNAEWER